MLNIYDTYYLKEYNILKKEALEHTNLKERLNEMMKKKLDNSQYLQNLFELYPNITKKNILNTVFSMYNNDYLFIHRNEIKFLKEALEDNNPKNKHKNYFNYKDNTLSNISLTEILENITTKYLNDFNIHRFLTLRISSAFHGKEYLIYYIQKFLLSTLILEFNDQGDSIHNLNIKFANNSTKSPEKEIDSKLSRLPIIPFLEQYISTNNSLNYNKKNIFGNISKDILTKFFSANIDVNPYNYRYLNLIKRDSHDESLFTHDKRSSYTYDKYLEFLRCFTPLIKEDKLDKLQEDILELITNANFILFNSALLPMKKVFKYGREKNITKHILSKKYCMKFYYNCSLIPMPEYRIILSAAFSYAFINNYILSYLDELYPKQIELTPENSIINYTSDTTVDAFNAYVERLSNDIIPEMVTELFLNVFKKYSLIDKKNNILKDNLMQLNKDLENSWNNIYKHSQNINYTAVKSKLVTNESYTLNYIHPKENLFIVKNNQLIANYSTNINKYLAKSIDENSFVNLQKFIFNAIYHQNKFIVNENNESLRIPPKVTISRIQNKPKLFEDFNIWYSKNKDKILKEINTLKK